ncbi:alpha/beta fold hydrolase [Streptomyces sp. NPDC021608]|uniref:alpha/beta hydrolase n=1 Tax=Streptomyces sp. NPDC021608 TaxID=3154903 RepID=UPI0033E17681
MSSLVLREHLVPHDSKIPANYGDPVQLPVREYDGTHGNNPHKPVLMLHGRSVPALAGFDLAPVPGGHATRYSWAQELAQDGYDVFLMDLQGSGRSPHPRVMDEPCNANPTQQQSVLVPHPLPEPCSALPPYPHELGNTESETAELETVVRFIRGLPGLDKPLRFVGWSAAALVMGPYVLQHPGDVESMFLLAPIFPPKGRWSQKPDDPFGRPPDAVTLPVSKPANMFGFPMHVAGKTGFKASLASTPAFWEPGIDERAWDACVQDDPVTAKWGHEEAPGVYEGVLRYRNTYSWGWNSRTAPHEDPAGTRVLGARIPLLIVYGELDRTANSPATFPDVLRFSVPALYDAVKGAKTLMFCLAGAGHSLVWETTAETLHTMSKQWFHNGKVEGVGNGSYFRQTDGELIPLP